jgi:hypothetical protein
MKLLQKDTNGFTFHLGKREKSLLLSVLRLYPLIPVSYHRVSREPKAGDSRADQALLEETMAAQKLENKGKVAAMMAQKFGLREDKSGYRLSLDAQQLEWLLQVLNDVRVGSWILLGCPDTDEGQQREITLKTARYYLVMEFAGYFQSVLLDALNGEA